MASTMPTAGDGTVSGVIGPLPSQPGVYDTFSARAASRSERRYYRALKGVRSDVERT